MHHSPFHPAPDPRSGGTTPGRRFLHGPQPPDDPASSGKHRLDRDALTEFGDQLGDVADLGDAVLGRQDAPSALPDEIGDLTADQIVPSRIGAHPTGRLVAGHLATGSAALALIAVVFAGGTLSGLLAPTLQVLRGTVSISSALTFFDAFFLTLALSLTAAICWFLVRSEVVRGWPAVGVATVGCLLSVALASALGIAGPTMDQVMAQMVGNPLAQLAGAFKAFLLFYGPVPFLGGVVTGVAVGNLCYRLAQAPPRG